ncbi:MBL fold metallo-hydrolase [Thermogemmatispora tikiterensis]|uniref:Rhodanese domain-containing protein n=1 Tax=Thermogemmatispora tikiterensis TaxID=1825093 RepID=A0A328VWD6_9CHLR|nr:MBL fold metallo-hydrolase [Thermogemmatispora tikiterensis]RAQ98455.1 hypothetical protein A4R35_23135 [Thermogemmatispora tikiterensis]
MASVSVETLRTWLESGLPVTILDVRPASAYAAWSIPGSQHLDAYEALKSGQTGGLEELELPADRPVVTVCEAGQVSQRAAALLTARGFTAYSLEGGMRAWSLAWNTAPVLPDPGVCGQPEAARRAQAPEQRHVIQIRRTGKGCLSYLISDGTAALVLDPALDPAVYQQQARQRGWQITAVLETHIHADHLSRARALAESCGASLLLPAQQRVAFPFIPVADGQQLAIGRLHLQALRTPGHTPESTCYLLPGPPGTPALLFSGDTLFPEGLGRPDLDADTEEARRRAEMLYASLQHLLTLPDNTILLAAHSARPLPFDGQPVLTTLAAVRTWLVPLLASPAVFSTQMLSNLPTPPAHYQEIIAANESGDWPAIPPEELEGGPNRCAVRL